MFLQSFCYICAYEFSFGNMDKIQKQRGSILLYMEEKHEAYYIRIEHPGMACCVFRAGRSECVEYRKTRKRSTGTIPIAGGIVCANGYIKMPFMMAAVKNSYIEALA